jgi:hypothetical protein
MGFRTVVILNNDLAHEWQKDPELGRKIFNSTLSPLYHRFTYGNVVECIHADTQTIGIIDSLDFTPLAYDSWTRNETPQEVELKMIKAAAEKLGYRLVKKP